MTTNLVQMNPAEPIGSSSLSASSVSGSPTIYSMNVNGGELFKALSKFFADVKNPAKDKSGYGYNYADLHEYHEEAKALMGQHELSVVQMPTTTYDENTGQARVHLTTILGHSSGEHIAYGGFSAVVSTSKNLSFAQEVGIVTTYLRRYAFGAIMQMVGQNEDVDGDVRDEPRRGPAQKRPAPVVSRPAPVVSKPEAPVVQASITPDLKSEAIQLAKECAQISLDGIPAYAEKLKDLGKRAGGMAIAKDGFVAMYNQLAACIAEVDASRAIEYGKLAEHFPKSFATKVNDLVNKKIDSDVFATKEGE